MKKSLGAYYTPEALARFVVKHLKKTIGNNNVSVLEPSVGNGVFFRSLLDCKINISNAKAIDIDDTHFDEISKMGINNMKMVMRDFLIYDTNEHFSLILGNPPYIKKSELDEGQDDLCKKICNDSGLKNNVGGNIWSAFMIKCVNLLADNGILAFILPSEILQVKFAKELMNFLRKSFARIEIITFNDLYFECKGQDTMLFVGYKHSNQAGTYFGHIKSLNRFDDMILENKDYIVNSGLKWIHHNALSKYEFILLEKLISKVDKINKYCTTSPGIVTAANNYFIVDRHTIEDYELEEYAFPILQKSSFMAGLFDYSDKDYYSLQESQKPSYVLHFDAAPIKDFGSGAIKYIQSGSGLPFVKNYKCKNRKYWYSIPNFPKKVPSAFVFKRCHNFPKLFINSAHVFVTDSAYQIEMKDGFDTTSLICSFYNSLTLVYSELYGRHYGGGVLELTPSEFKNLPLPYFSVSIDEYDEIVSKYKFEENLLTLVKKNDQMIMHKYSINENEMQILESIHQRLVKIRVEKKIIKQENSN